MSELEAEMACYLGFLGQSMHYIHFVDIVLASVGTCQPAFIFSSCFIVLFSSTFFHNVYFPTSLYLTSFLFSTIKKKYGTFMPSIPY